MLHRLVLSTTISRRTAFEIETLLFGTASDATDSHAFITGMARSGTTAILNAIESTGEFASLTYEDMPFLLSPNLWQLLRPKTVESPMIERAHGDGMLVSTKSAEAFEEVFWSTFDLENGLVRIDDYINLVMKARNKNRYLSKNNQNFQRIGALARKFPKSTFLVMYRQPLQQSYSLLRQHQRFCAAQEEDSFVHAYMASIGHKEFGASYKPPCADDSRFLDQGSINHWLEQWILFYSELKRNCGDLDNVFFICYEKLCNDAKLWSTLCERLDLSLDSSGDFTEAESWEVPLFDHSLYVDALQIYDRLDN